MLRRREFGQRNTSASNYLPGLRRYGRDYRAAMSPLVPSPHWPAERGSVPAAKAGNSTPRRKGARTQWLTNLCVFWSWRPWVKFSAGGNRSARRSLRSATNAQPEGLARPEIVALPQAVLTAKTGACKGLGNGRATKMFCVGRSPSPVSSPPGRGFD